MPKKYSVVVNKYFYVTYLFRLEAQHFLHVLNKQVRWTKFLIPKVTSNTK